MEQFDANGLQGTGEEDFDGLVQKAADKIVDDKIKGRETIFLHKSRYCRLKRIRHILIDEYQDFSELFHRLIEAVRKQNRHVSFFCVGDNWQAINGFAGSDLYFFNNFSEIFADSRRLDMPTNYRSARMIVDIGNALMQSLIQEGDRRGHAIRPDAGKTVIADLGAFSPTLQEKKTTHGDYSTHAVLRLVNKIINDGKEVVLLSRTNTVPWHVNYGDGTKSSNQRGLDRFLVELRSRLPAKQKNKLTISTVHKYKGGEKEVVIVLDALNRRYPLLHPNLIFTRVLGDSIEHVTDEERRLFYVAMTRAVDELYVLSDFSEEDNPSLFLKDLEGNENISRLKWSDYLPLMDRAKNITIIVGNQNGHGTYPTTTIRDLLKAEGYRWDEELGVWYLVWYLVSAGRGFSVTQFAKQARWSRRADGVEVCFCDYLDKVLAKYHINSGKWECVFDTIAESTSEMKQ